MLKISIDVLPESLGIEILHSLFISHRNAQEFHVYILMEESEEETVEENYSPSWFIVLRMYYWDKTRISAKTRERTKTCRTRRLFSSE